MLIKDRKGQRHLRCLWPFLYPPYVIVSLTIDGAEEFPVKPLGLMPNYYIDKELVPGTYRVEVCNSWWQDAGSRFTKYRW